MHFYLYGTKKLTAGEEKNGRVCLKSFFFEKIDVVSLIH